MVKPIINYYGGKRKDAKHIVPIIRDHLAEDGTYYEPFVGGGAVWLALGHKKNVIADIVPDLMNMYDCIQSNPQLVLMHYKHFNNDKDSFYKIRNLDRSVSFLNTSSYFRAARYIYLTICSFGTVTFNSKGQANQSYFQQPERNIDIDLDNYNSLVQLLKNTEVKLQDFSETLNRPSYGDFVYLDPPYIESRYDKYYIDHFTLDDMKALKKCCDELTERGVNFALSHSKNEKVLDLFNDYKIKELAVSRDIIKSHKFDHGTDYLITNFL